MAIVDRVVQSTRSPESFGLNELVTGMPGADTAAQQRVASAHAQVQHASAVLREAVAELHETEGAAWQRYGADADRAMALTETELSSAETELRIEQAKSRSQLSDALQQVANSWRARTDQLRLQSDLGEMDARDSGLRALDTLEQAGRSVLAMIEDLRRDSTAPVSTLRGLTRRAVADVRDAFEGVVTPPHRAESVEAKATRWDR
jgi:hypothetical protein